MLLVTFLNCLINCMISYLFEFFHITYIYKNKLILKIAMICKNFKLLNILYWFQVKFQITLFRE